MRGAFSKARNISGLVGHGKAALSWRLSAGSPTLMDSGYCPAILRPSLSGLLMLPVHIPSLGRYLK